MAPPLEKRPCLVTCLFIISFWSLLSVEGVGTIDPTTTPPQESNLEAPAVKCDVVPADFCLNNGTCREPTSEELWECSADIGIGPLKCDCTSEFTGSRCETRLSCSDLSCASGEVCDYNWSKQTLECIPTNTAGSPPVCQSAVRDVEFQFEDKILDKHIICFDMYNFSAHSLCSDSDDSLTYLISQGPAELPNLFCLVVDYHSYKTCLRVNATHRDKIVKSQYEVELQAEEYSVLERRASFKLLIIFNTPPMVQYSLISWVTNTAGLMSLDVIAVAGVKSSTKLTLTNFNPTDADIVSHSFANDTLNLNLTKPSSYKLHRLEAEVQIADSGKPQLSASVTVQITLLRFDCLALGTFKIDLNKLVAGSSFSIGRIQCTVTPGYQLEYDLPIADLPPGMTFTITTVGDMILNIQSHSSELLTKYYSCILVQLIQQPHLKIPVCLNMEFYYYSLIWFQQADQQTTTLGTQRLDIPGDLQSSVTAEVNSVINNTAVVSEVVQVRDGSWLDIQLKSADNQLLQAAILSVISALNTSMLGNIRIKPKSIESVKQASYIFKPVVRFDAVSTFTENDVVTVICEADFINTERNVDLVWTLDGVLIQPLQSSRFQLPVTKEYLNTWKVRSTLRIDQVKFIDTGRLGCQVSDGNGNINTGSTYLSVISPPVVRVSETIFIRQGSKLSINCSITSTGGGITTLKWIKDGVEVSSGGVLTDSPNEDTEFTCIGSNSAGQGQPKTSKVIIIQGQLACASEKDLRNIQWLLTSPGGTANEPCPSGYAGSASRFCRNDGSWQEAEYKSCIQTSLVDIQNQIAKLEDGISTAAPEKLIANMSTITQQAVLEEAEVVVLVNAVKDLTSIIGLKNQNSTTSQQESTEAFAEVIVELVGNLFDPKQNLQDVSAENTSISLLLLDVMDEVGQLLGEAIPVGQNVTIAKDTIVMAVGKPDPFNIRNVSFPGDNSNLTLSMWTYLPANVFKTNNDYESVIWSVISYTNLRSLPSNISNNLSQTKSTSSQAFQINSDMVSINIHAEDGGFDANNLKSDILFIFAHLNSTLNDAACSYWDVDFSRWDNKGCRLISTNQTASTCSCNHMTNFALLMKPADISVQDEEILSTITLIGCTVSIFCLLITILIYAFVWRYVRSDRAILLVNLCVALVIALVIFLFGVDQTQHKIVCTSIAVGLHYFYLVVFFLMLGEGIEVLVSIVKVFSSRSKLRQLLIMGWGVPIVIVSISMGVTELDGYGNNKFCWLSVNSGLIWAFIGPALFIILVNFIIVVKITSSLLNTRVMINKDIRIKAKAALRSICVLLPVMGVAWVFGVLAVNNDLVVFDYMFTVLNTLQGLFIFIFHCVINRKVQEGLANRRRRYRSRHTDLSAPQISSSKTGFDRSRKSSRRNYGDEPYGGDAGTVLKTGLDNEGFDRRGYFGDHYMGDIPRKRPVERLCYPSMDYSYGHMNHFPEVSDGYSNLSISENPVPLFPNQDIAQSDLNQELFRPALMRGNSGLSGGFSERSGSSNSDELSVFSKLPRPKLVF